MSNLVEAADGIRRLAKLHEHMVTAAAALERIGSLENAEAEARQRVAQANADLRVVLEQAEEVKQTTTKARADCEQLIARVEAEVAEVRKTAQDAAELAQKEAAGTSARVVAEAQERARQIVDAAKEARAAEERVVAEAREALEGVRAEITAKSEELKSIEDRINAARRTIAEFAG